MKISPYKTVIAITTSLFLVACQDSNADKKPEEPIVVQPPVVVETATKVVLDQALEHVTLSDATMYYIDVEEGSPALTVSFATGLAGDALGDPDLYVRYQDEPTAGEEGTFDCVSFGALDWNELCIIDKPQAGRYYILVDAFDQGNGAAVTDGTLWASTTLFNNTQTCQVPVNIRAQQMTDEKIDQACAIVERTKERFDQVLNASIAPEFQQAVTDDLNEVTFINVFANLTNHKAWLGYLYSSDNDSGIFFETEPTKFNHNAEILTFDAIGWTGGRSVVRSLDHEYVHALDGRYNKEGAYRADMSWWSEGLAEYIGTFYNEPYQLFEISVGNDKYTLAEIFETHNNDYVPSPYDWGFMAVAFLIEKHPEDVTTMLTHMRAGEWDAYNSLLGDFVANYEAEFVDYYTNDIKALYLSTSKTLALNGFEKVEGRGGWTYAVTVPDGATSVTITTSGGSGDIDLMVSKGSVPHWSFATDPECYSYNDGNEESCTFSDVSAGVYYAVVDSYFVGSDVVDMYISACSGVECSVELPEPIVLIEATAPVLPVSVPLPPVGEIGSCDLETTYYDGTGIAAEGFSVTNPTDVAVTLYWISPTGKANLSSAYATLAKGESYTADYWKQGDRLMITDKYNSCLGVAVLNNQDNDFTISEELVADFVELLPPTIGSCDLLVPYTRTENSASNFSIANSTDNEVTLHWVDNSSGEMYLDSNYGVLLNGDSYAADFWVEGDRMALVDNNSVCLGVVELSAANNAFVIDATLFE
jgi:hypothetical protein